MVAALAITDRVHLDVEAAALGEVALGDAEDLQLKHVGAVRVDEHAGLCAGRRVGCGVGHFRHQAAPVCSTSVPEDVWVMRKMMNSAGFTGATPISVTTCPASMTSVGLVSSSHLTKNASSAVRPIKAPSRHRRVKKAPTSRRMFFHSVRSLGSKTIQLVESPI